jgi:murein DD-endopeptidase MepM/ murein hydrolase activator NlpD
MQICKPVDNAFIFRGFIPYNSANPNLYHGGLDIDGNDSRIPYSVFCSKSGIIAYICTDIKSTFGLWLAVRLPDNYYSIYAHLNEIYSELYVNNKIDSGSLIGIMGSTGLSTGRHLHYEERPLLSRCIARNPTDVAALYL